ncbi:MAG: transposase [Prosthecobacter sp.]|uniref:transposase n=1 Tax=Prosthecobacter sp. TaxID=1965333 RepID=UPI0038FEAF24
MPFIPFDPGKEVHNHRLKLPHWRQWGTTYFITARLADSLPTHVLDEWRELRDSWLAAHGISSARQLDQLPEDQRHAYHREFTARFHELLDAGHGECVLAKADLAAMLVSKLTAGHGSDYYLDAWVIMPNHFHALVEPIEGTLLGEIIQRWKGGSAREINLACGRSGQLWQHEPFDHILRSEAQLNHFRRYIALNPEKAGLRDGFVLGVGAESGLTADEVLSRFALKREAK